MQRFAFRRPVAPSKALPSASAFDAESFDFTAYLARRLGVRDPVAADVLGFWLTHYDRMRDASADLERPADATTVAA